MKIIIDTEMKKTICPKAFFDNIRQINQVAKLTGRKEDIHDITRIFVNRMFPEEKETN